MALLYVIIAIGIVILMLATSAIKIVQEYERGVIFRLGRIQGAKGPGLFFIWPIIDKMTRIDLRVVTHEVPPQEVITRDNVTVKVTAVVFFRVVDPNAAVIQVMDYLRATSQISQTTLRSALGQADLDHLLSNREQLNQQIQKIIDESTEPWGIKVSVVEIKDVELPQTMQRAMARQAEAEREKRAKVIAAEGEFLASQQLAAAAHVIAQEEGALQLRYLQTLAEIATEKNSTIVFPLPIDIIEPFLDAVKRGNAAGNSALPSSSGNPANV
ncbi:MAG TPA: slipin family protein [Chloroflexota bacterium]|nr:slipin family protein [Chloroflexota bacterium]